ncbi:DedA family protein [Streptomyces sp. NPDC058000]|uniref:DedA family protein n=1 Tax=Streptomyces sp. NPDC058000 TaxID=3346299 RepID=UPI0036E7EA3E
MTGASWGTGGLDAGALLSRYGAWAVLAVVFAETGLPILGAFLPGDTLLLPAGLLCAPGTPGRVHLSLPLVLLCAGLGSAAGAQTGFWAGRRSGRLALAHGPAGRPRPGLERAEAWFARYGHRRAVLLGRFVPVVRTLVHPAAGMLGMPAATFTLWQVLAGLAWSQSLVLAGYALGSAGNHGAAYLAPVIAAVLAAGIVPPVWQWGRSRRAARDTQRRAAP